MKRNFLLVGFAGIAIVYIVLVGAMVFGFSPEERRGIICAIAATQSCASKECFERKMDRCTNKNTSSLGNSAQAEFLLIRCDS